MIHLQPSATRHSHENALQILSISMFQQNLSCSASVAFCQVTGQRSRILHQLAGSTQKEGVPSGSGFSKYDMSMQTKSTNKIITSSRSIPTSIRRFIRPADLDTSSHTIATGVSPREVWVDAIESLTSWSAWVERCCNIQPIRRLSKPGVGWQRRAVTCRGRGIA